MFSSLKMPGMVVRCPALRYLVLRCLVMSVLWEATTTSPSIVQQLSSRSTHCRYTVIKISGFRVPSRDVTYKILPGRELFNYSRSGRVWSVTSRLGTRKPPTFFLQCMPNSSKCLDNVHLGCTLQQS